MPIISGSAEAGWLADRRDTILRQVSTQGWLLIRGLPLTDRAAAVASVRELIGQPFVEREGFGARAPLAPGVYSPTEWPADQPLCMHHELSHRRVVPGRMAFACVTAPESGGGTAVADARAVLAGLPADLVARFATTGWQLSRSFREEVGVRWQDAFGTDDPGEVTAYCVEHGIGSDWATDGSLRTTQSRPAVVRHPETGEECWFNQIAFLNEHTMAPEIRDYLIAAYGPGGLPFTTTAGDGSPVTPQTVDTINLVYDKHSVCEPWRPGDLLVVDNILTAHSREPYRGDREIVVGMGEPVAFAR